ncbi:MAG: hypothetical protein VXW27_10305, partial [Pseudomonadota bacterium]|nr:hypothetical protein [Pseudomonadota bacterium]
MQRALALLPLALLGGIALLALRLERRGAASASASASSLFFCSTALSSMRVAVSIPPPSAPSSRSESAAAASRDRPDTKTAEQLILAPTPVTREFIAARSWAAACPASASRATP